MTKFFKWYEEHNSGGLHSTLTQCQMCLPLSTFSSQMTLTIDTSEHLNMWQSKHVHVGFFHRALYIIQTAKVSTTFIKRLGRKELICH